MKRPACSFTSYSYKCPRPVPALPAGDTRHLPALCAFHQTIQNERERQKAAGAYATIVTSDGRYAVSFRRVGPPIVAQES